jgi:MFS family permease
MTRLTARPPWKLDLPRTVVALGFVSLLTDASSEMIYPLLPAFLVSLGAGATFVGLVEGIAESTASFVKLLSGVWSDRLPRRKPLVLAGYGLASAVRPLVALATAPWQVLAIRFVDRVGKGVRSSPRDALIVETTPEERRGMAFGFHRAMDHTGALIGPLIAFALMSWLGLTVRWVFAAAAVPAVATMIVLIFTVREPSERKETTRPEETDIARPALPRPLLAYLAVLAVFTLGNPSDAFLLLRASQSSVPEAQLPLLWAFIHVVKATLSTPLGSLSDRLGRKPTILAGWAVYAACYLGFALAHQAWQVWALFAGYGAFFAATEGTEKALVADLSPPEACGWAFGAFNFLVGLMALPASLGFGFLWDRFGPFTAFATGAALAAFAGVGLLVLVPRRGLALTDRPT